MTPIFKKTFDSPTLVELKRLSDKEWMHLKSIDLTILEYLELVDIFADEEYTKQTFEIGRDNVTFNKVIITIAGQNGLSYLKPKGKK